MAWALWRSAQGEPTPILPAEPVHVALFLVHRAERDKSSVNVAQHPATAINGVHRLLGLPPPSSHLSAGLLKAIARERGRPARRAKPLTVKLVRELVKVWGGDDHPVYKVMIVAMVLIGFAGFLRLGELLALKRGDVQWDKGCVRIFVEVSKTDQVRVGSWVVIAKTGSAWCPRAFLKRYMARVPSSDEDPLFRCIWRRSVVSTGHPSLGDKKMQSSTFHEYLRQALRAAGVSKLETMAFSGHSLRRGGSTVAAQSRMPGHWRMHQGRWKSMASADLYVGAVTQDALQLTRSLGL